ncbi:MAG: metallophosphoesterase [Nitrospira sp.]
MNALDSAREQFQLQGAHRPELLLSGVGEVLRGRFRLFGWALGEESSVKAQEAGEEAGPDGLFLVPNVNDETRAAGDVIVGLTSPFEQVAAHPERLPGILLWTPGGTSVIVAQKDFDSIWRQLRVVMNQPGDLAPILQAYESKRRPVRILHMSDLHFGRSDTEANLPGLKQWLWEGAEPQLDYADHVVISGDLIDRPDEASIKKFLEFQNELITHQGPGRPEPIAVPGNHDSRWKGNRAPGLPRPNFKYVAKLGQKPGVIDDKRRLVIFCFDSAEANDTLAKGRVSKDSLELVDDWFAAKCQQDPDVRWFMRVAVLHHHPYSWIDGKSPFDKIRNTFLEPALEMKEPERFLAWCATRRVDVILHGHKHIPREVSQWVTFSDGSPAHELRTVACGSSLGAEGTEMSCVKIVWDSTTRKWNTVFYSRGKEGSFKAVSVVLHQAKRLDI